MKPKNLTEYASDEQEKEQLRKLGERKSKTSVEGVDGDYPTFETTGGKSPLTLNKRKGKTY